MAQESTLDMRTARELADLAVKAAGIDIVVVQNKAGAAGIPAEIPVGILHGPTPQVVDLRPSFDRWRDRPSAKVGTATAQTLASFVALTNRHKTPHSAVFADVDWHKPSLTAVIDYHEIGAQPVEAHFQQMTSEEVQRADHVPVEMLEEITGSYAPRPDNLKHRILYTFPLSDPWKAWIDQNHQSMTQGDFAAWIEDHITDIAAPSEDERLIAEETFNTTIAAPNELMRLSRGLQITVSSIVKDIKTLQSGASQIVFEETHTDASGEPLKVPGLFILSVEPFVGGAKMRLPVRLRYRAQAGRSTSWFFEIWRPDLAISTRIADDIATVTTDTSLPIFEGTPETSA